MPGKARKSGKSGTKEVGKALAEDGNAHQQLSRICSKLLDYENMLRLLLNLSGCRKLSTHPCPSPPGSHALPLILPANLLALQFQLRPAPSTIYHTHTLPPFCLPSIKFYMWIWRVLIHTHRGNEYSIRK